MSIWTPLVNWKIVVVSRSPFHCSGFKVGEGLGVAVVAAAERYTPKAGSGAPWEQNVKGVIILRRDDDGLWRGTHFIWNRDAPATQ